MKLLKGFFFVLLLALTVSAQTKTVTVITEKANLRGTPSPKGSVVEEVSQGEVFELITSKGAWYLVQTSRFVGWMHGNTIKLNFNAQAETPIIISEAPVSSQAAENSIRSSVKDTTTVEKESSTSSATATSAQTQNSEPQPSNNPSTERTYITGPKGGCYYINSNGNKTYVDHSLCAESQPSRNTTTSTPSSNGTVQVKGYYRKDGTYVKPYTRSKPRKP